MNLKEGRFHLVLLRRGRGLQCQLLLQLRPHPEIGTLPRMLHLFEALHLLLYSIHRLDRIHPIEVNRRHVQNRHLRVVHQPPDSDLPPGVWFAGNGPPRNPGLSGPPGSPPRPVVPPPGFLSEPKQGNVRPPPTSGGKPSFAPEKEKQPKKNPASTFNAPEKEKQPKKNPASTFNAQHNAAPVTPPYNPPDREPKATPRKREKKQEPGRASTDQPPVVEKSADEMLDEELRKTNAQSSTDQPTEVDLERLFVDAYQATGAELLQQSGMAESTETVDTSDPLTPFLAYVLFVLHYRSNPFPDSWLIFKHSEMREIRHRKRAVLAYCRPWSTISHSEIDDVCLELLTLFEEAPRPESMNSGVFRTFAKALTSAKVRVANHFKPGAKSYEVPGCNSKLYFFEVQSFPGPEPPGQAHIAWAHCSDVPGSVGILASGRVIRAAAWTLGLRPDQESMSFFGRCHTNIGWTDNFIEWASTKNRSGIVFGGYMGGNFAKSPSANTVLENSMCPLHQAVHSVSKDKRWAIRESAARIDYTFYRCRSRFGRLPGSIHAEYYRRQD